jgi:hypothetical protein
VDPDSGSGTRREKITYRNKKSKEISCFEALDVIFIGLKASPLTKMSFMKA